MTLTRADLEQLRHTEYNSDPVIMAILDRLDSLEKVREFGREAIQCPQFLCDDMCRAHLESALAACPPMEDK